MKKQTCPRCGAHKLIVEFPRRGKGRMRWCKPCCSQISSESGRATRRIVPDKPRQADPSGARMVPCYAAFPTDHPWRTVPLGKLFTARRQASQGD